MNATRKPVRWQSTDDAIRAVQVAFDVEEAVLAAVRQAAFESNRSTSDQIRALLGLSTSSRPKRPRLTVSLMPRPTKRWPSDTDWRQTNDRLAIKEQVTRELIRFAETK